MAEETWTWKQFVESITFKRVFGILFLILFAVFVWTIWNEGSSFTLAQFGGWLRQAGQPSTARGLITFVVVGATLIIALALVGFLIFGDSKDRDKRFSQGKEVLTIFIGILGTIMGFYYAEGSVAVEKIDTLKGANTVVVVSAAGLEKKGFEALIGFNFESALKAFTDAGALADHSPEVDKINVVFESNKDSFTSGTDEEKKGIWKTIFCAIKSENSDAAVPAELKAGFDEIVEQYDCGEVNPTGSPPVESLQE